MATQGDSDAAERERQEAQTLAQHLPSGFTADFVPQEADAEPITPAVQPPPTGEDVSSLTLQGGDVHRSLFRMAEAPSRTASPASPASPASGTHHRRAATVHEAFSSSNGGSVRGGSKYGSTWTGPIPIRDLMAPQGFRRAFVQQQQQQRQRAAVQRRWDLRHLRRKSSFGAARIPITRNFVEFLELYGHFADEDLETSDEEEEEEEEEEGVGEGSGGDEDEDEEDVERRALLRQTSGTGESGKARAGMAQAFFTLLKAFVGTGIMFLPKAYRNGGMAFSTATLLVVALLSMRGFQLLLACRQRHGGGYGDIGQAIAGAPMRRLILGSIALSQLGFVCAGMVFVAENMASFAAAVAATHGHGDNAAASWSTTTLIALEAAVLVPLALVRDIARLGPAALLGDVFIGAGLAYMCAYDVWAVAARGWTVAPTVQPWFNPAGYTLTVGAAIFTFEGIGLILPIQSSMARPQRFGALLRVVMALITVAYIGVGALCYAAFGADTRTEVIDNYPRDSALVQAVQCLYALAVLAGLPVQLFPAVRILEGPVFGRGAGRSGHSGKRDPRVKWLKNGLRAAMVALCAAIAVLGAGHLDRFVALIGSLACVPLLFIYPPYLHYRSIAGSAGVRAADVALIVVGAVAMVFTTAVTVAM